ncbi:hypothetical protein DL96DRAFT_1590849 [Flagelloscypha sp. PMI_526]|nr:hypothetical protein DL96DRAFT_1590849 [Flagelloscypha sp. PMI_526]
MLLLFATLFFLACATPLPEGRVDLMAETWNYVKVEMAVYLSILLRFFHALPANVTRHNDFSNTVLSGMALSGSIEARAQEHKVPANWK